ncbi:DUF6220 domain-containing protein [Bacillus sp. SD088]|uniref:DUF6220 domain-containing protein n=1 Tax=Bacillus sp. SD088 TaxID=2782012 RepID=UPI001A962CBA|nr:DUF6220 domain-containing protein [Bacillus sp. SD088]MBO0992672.1 hypothetical protein [Bacillus sp. SD088]
MEQRNVATGVQISRYAYTILAMIFAACLLVQVFLSGMAIFWNATNWQLHIAFVNFFQYIPVILLILAFTGQIKGGLRWMPIGLIVLIIIQYATVNMTNYIAAIHPVTGMGMFVLAINTAQASWGLSFQRNHEQVS